jgi:hypothetical protein
MSLCSSPDTSGMNDAARANADISKEALAWYKEKDAAAAPMQAKLQNAALEVAGQQLASSKANDALAADYANYNKTTFRPLEQGIVADAAAYDTPEKRQQAADAAMADVNSANAATTEAGNRRMASMGINPGSARALAANDGADVAQAGQLASAAFNARQGVETIGAARKMDAASLGRGLSSAQATSAGLALQAGNSAVSNTAAPISAANSSTNTNGAGFGTAIQGNASAANIYGQAANISGQDSGAWGALGGVAGQFAGSKAGSAGIASMLGMSDVNVKSDIQPEDPAAALAEVNATPVSNWKYDPAKMAASGIDPSSVGPGQHTGPMAQDVNATMGEQAAPGGKKIDLVTMNGKTMAAVQALDKKINSLAAMIRGGQIQAGAAA